MNYLERLAAVADADITVLRPRRPSPFEAVGPLGDADLVEIDDEIDGTPVAAPTTPAREPVAPLAPVRRAADAGPATPAVGPRRSDAGAAPPDAPSRPAPPHVDRVEPAVSTREVHHHTTEIEHARHVEVVRTEMMRPDDPRQRRDGDPERPREAAPVPTATATDARPTSIRAAVVVADADARHDRRHRVETAEAAPTVEVHIGNIDIRPPAPTVAAASPVAEPFRPLRSGPDLDEYLRTGGRG